MPYLVIQDVISTCDRNVRYAKALDEIAIISKREHVLIVENKTGSRFPAVENLIIEVSQSELKSINEINSIITDLSERRTTPANIQRLKIQEQRLKQLLKI